MYRILSIFLCFVFFQSGSSNSLKENNRVLSDTDLQCMQIYNGTLSNDFLIGEWRGVYLFGLFVHPVPASSCIKVVFSELTTDELAEYKNHYTNPSMPYDKEDSPLKYDESDGYYEGMVMGNNEVKYFVLKPTSSMVVNNGFRTTAYRSVNDNYMLYILCNLRSFSIWLYSRGAELPSIEAMNAVIAGIPEIRNLDSQRYCA